MLPDGTPAGHGQYFRIRFGPTPVTLPAQEVSSTSATLAGTLNPNGTATVARFEYGPDPTLKTFATVKADELGPRIRPRPVTAQKSNLEAGQPYYFRILGKNVENALSLIHI